MLDALWLVAYAKPTKSATGQLTQDATPLTSLVRDVTFEGYTGHVQMGPVAEDHYVRVNQTFWLNRFRLDSWEALGFVGGFPYRTNLTNETLDPSSLPDGIGYYLDFLLLDDGFDGSVQQAFQDAVDVFNNESESFLRQGRRKTFRITRVVNKMQDLGQDTERRYGLESVSPFTLGAFGPASSFWAAILVPIIEQRYQIPVLSIAADPNLRSPKLYPLFARLMPSTKVQGDFLGRVIVQFDWLPMCMIVVCSFLAFLFPAMLCCVVLCCVVLCCVVLCCVVLCCVVLCRVVLCCVVLCCVVLCCVVLCCVVLCCVVLCCVVLCCVVLCCVVLCCVVSFHVVSCCVVLRCVALRCVVLCCLALCCVMVCCVVLCCAVASAATQVCPLRKPDRC